MSKEEELRKDRVMFILAQKGVKTAKDIVSAGDALYMNVYKQLFSSEARAVSSDVIAYLLEKYPDVSADYIMRGEGPWERTHIVTPATHRQDIHISDGARVAISQLGNSQYEEEPIGHESLSSLLEEKDKEIAKLKADIATLKDAIRVLSAQ